jgi:hypothetical protein
MSHCTVQYVKIPATIIQGRQDWQGSYSDSNDVINSTDASNRRDEATAETATSPWMPVKTGSSARVRKLGTKGATATARIVQTRNQQQARKPQVTAMT